jgi:peroxin-14
LRSKNLTQEEIDLALARAGDGSTVPQVVPRQLANPSNYGYLNQQVLGQYPGPGYGYGYGPYQGGFLGVPPEYVELVCWIGPSGLIE